MPENLQRAMAAEAEAAREARAKVRTYVRFDQLETQILIAIHYTIIFVWLYLHAQITVITIASVRTHYTLIMQQHAVYYTIIVAGSK